MKKPVRILIVEDIASDVDLAKNEICKIVDDCNFQVVETYEGFLRAIQTFEPDVIISDYTLPRFDGLKALALTQKHAPLTPFIMWTGSISENLAVECMRAGADNYIFKDDLKRLGPAVVHALEERSLLLARKQAEEEIKERERQLGILLDNLPGPVYRCRGDSDFTVEFISDGIEELSGYQAQDFREHRQHLGKMIHPDDRARVWMEIQAAVERNQPFELVYRIHTATGEEKWVWEKGQGIRDAEGQLRALEGFITDVTVRKQAEEKYQSIFENSMEGIFQSSPQGYFLNVNPAMAGIYGYGSTKEMLKSIKNIATQIYVELDKRSEFMHLLDSNDSVENFEARNYLKDGGIIWTSTSARVVRDQNGNILYYEGSTQDITQRKKAEESLQNNEKRFRALIENGLDDISLLAADGRLLWESPSTVRNLGYQPNEFVGRSIFELMHPEDLEWTRETYAKLLQRPGDRQRGTFRLRRSDGTWRWVEAIATNMLDDITVNAIVINYRDITEQKQAEIQLQQRNNDLALINALNEIINRGENLDAVVDLLRQEVKRIFSSEYTNIYLLSQDGQWIRMRHYSLPPAVTRRIERLIGHTIPPINVPVRDDGFFQRVLRSGQGMVLSGPEVNLQWMGEFIETASLPPAAKAAIRKLLPQIHKILNIQSTILVPLISDGKTLGVLNVSGSNFFTEQDLKRIENIGGQLTMTLQRRQVEEVLNEERNLLRTLIDNLPDRIYATDMHGRKTLSNTADWQASGRKTMEDVIGRTDFELYPSELAEEFWQLDKVVLDSGQPVINYEEPGLDTDGNRVSILTTKIPLRDETGNVIGLVGIGRDITERKQTEERINDLLSFNEKILNHSPMGILTYKFTGECVFANENAAMIAGTNVEQLKTLNFHTLESWKKSGFYDLVQKAMTSLSPVTADIHHTSMFGKEAWVTVHCTAFKLKSEDHLLLFLTDITERKQVEEKLLSSQRDLAEAQRVAKMGNWSWDVETKTAYWSDEAYQVLGIDKTTFQITRDNFIELVHPEDRALVKQTTLETLRDGKSFNIEYRIVTPTDEVKTMNEIGYAVKDNSGKIVSIFGLSQDITQRKQAEAERQALLEIMQGLANTRDLQELLKLVHHSIAKVIYAENFYVCLHQETTGLFEEIYSVDQYDPPEPPSKLENSITAYVFRSGKPLLLTQASFEELAAQGKVSLIGTDSASWLGVPLKTSGRTIGVMAVQDYENDNRYSDREKDFLSSIATQVALVIERKRAEEALRESEEHYRTIFEGVQDAIFVESLDGKILMVNERACEMFGYSPAEFLTKTVADLVPTGHSILMAGRTESSLSAEPRETINQRANGEAFPIEISGRVQVINGEQVLLVVVRDITERKKAEMALVDSNTRFRTLFEASPDAILLIDPEEGWSIVDCNTAACQMNGYSREELIGQCIDILNAEPPKPNERAEYAASIQQHEILHYETSHRRKDGTIFAVEVSTSLINVGARQLVLGIDRDITERKQAEASLQAEREKAQNYLDIAGVMMLALDHDGMITLINQKGCEILGYSADEIIGKSWIDTFLPEAIRPELHEIFQKLISDDIESSEYYENSILTKSGEERLIAWHNTLLRDEQGRIISSLSSGEDITERRKVETAFIESNNQFRTLFEASPDAILLIDPNGDWPIIDCNTAACQMNGYTREELLGQCIDMLNVMPLETDEKSGYLESIRQHGVMRYETYHRRKDGTVLTVDVSTSIIRVGNREIILGIDRDITERKRSEEEIRRRAEETSALLETSLALTNLDLEATLQTIGNSANTLFLADGCRVFLMEPDDETLRCVLALGENTEVFLDLRIKIGEGVTGAVAASGTAEIVNEMQNDPRAMQVPGTEEEQEAIMFAPLKERDRTIGILSIRRLGEHGRFQLADLELLEAFASMAASAVSNARLFEETQSHLAELRASEARFQQLADNIQEAFWITDAETDREIYMSPAIETIWGRSVQSMMEPGAYISSIFPEDQSSLLDAIKKEKCGEKMQFEYRIVRPDGSLRWIWDRAFPIFDETGKVKRIAGISADITERKDAAEKLRESEDRYHSLFQNQLHGSALHEIVTNDQGQPVDYIFLKVNPAFEKMTGLKAQDLIGRRVTEVIPAIENGRLIQIYGRVALSGEPAHLSEYVAPLGRFYEINAYATGPRQFAVSFMDVTERRQAEQQLRKLSRAVEQSSSTIVITDTAGNIEYVNPKFIQITGYSVEEVIGQNPRLLKSGFTSDEEYKQLWQAIGSGNEWHGELLNKKKDGTLFWESVTISPILNDRREITHFVGIKEDITERKQSEIETRRHIAELEAVYENGLSVGRLLEPAEIGNRVIETFARYLPWHHVTIRLRKEESDELELVAFSLPNLKQEERTDAEQHFVARINKVGQGLSGWVIQTGKPLRTGNVHAHPQYIDTHNGIQSGLYMPLKVGERVIGVISVESEAPNAFTEQDERLLATLANQTAVAFENARLYEAMQKELSERRRVEDALRVSETHYRALADSITDILFELDQELHYTHWNKASETLTGIPAQNAIGKSMEEILGATEEQARIRTIYEDVLKRHQPRLFETTLSISGEKRFFEVTAYPSMRGVSVVAKDVTDRKRTEAIMQKRFELMEYSARHSLKDLMQKTVDEVSELTGSTIGFFHFMQEDQIHLGTQTWSTNALQLFHVSLEDGAHLPLDRAGVWAEAVRQRRPLIQNDYESLARKKGIPQGHVPILREIVIPIIRNECIMAVMGIGNRPQDYTPRDLEIAARLADYAWDITERKQMEIALELERNQLVQRVEERTADLSRANSNLARALRVKDEFLANMSHELRTPLNAILGLSESLGEQIAGPLNEKQQKYISTISESGHHLLALINDILDLAKIDAGHITLDINKVDIRSVCQASLRMIKQLAQKKNQEVSLEIDDGLGLMWADERRLKQMIVNLLGNAVKFTPENGKLGLEVHGDQEANQVSITVWDNGIGIKEDDLARLFQPFVQLDSGLAREATGTGLGLALVAQMARLHGGGVTAVSDAGKGSRFTIVLPWEPALAIDTASRMRITGKFRAIQPENTNKPTVLLVEDTQEVVMMLKDYLELTGYRVFTAQDGIDGIVQARHVKPDLILMDVQMPRMDGFETTRKLRSDPNFRYTPIIALTALAMPHDRERCLEAGMDEYISKPVNLKALVKIIQSCLFEQESRTR